MNQADIKKNLAKGSRILRSLLTVLGVATLLAALPAYATVKDAADAGVKANWTAVLNKPVVAATGAGAAILYTAADTKLKLLSNGESLLVNEGASPGVTPERQLMLAQGNTLNIAWREMYNRPGEPGGHVLKFRASRDGGKTLGKVVEVAKTVGTPIGYFELHAGQAGQLYLVWSHADKKEAGLYLAVSTDGGKSWKQSKIPHSWTEQIREVPAKVESEGEAKKTEDAKPEILYGAPRLFQAVAGNKTVEVYWIETNPGKGGVQLKMAAGDANGQEWTAPVVVGEAQIINQIRALQHKHKSYVFWTGQQDSERVVYTLNGAVREGDVWRKLDSHPKLFSAYDFLINAASSDKVDHLLFTTSLRETTNSVEQVYATTFDTGTAKWSELTNIATSIPNYTSEILPEMTATPEGEVVVWWNDYRKVRSSVFMNVSHDFGLTWQKHDVAVSDASANAKTYDMVIGSGGTIQGYWLEYPDGNIRDFQLKPFHAAISALKNEAPALLDENRLRERVAQYWAARMAGNPIADYGLLDPISRASIPIMSYRYAVNVKITDYAIKAIKIKGNFAKVDVEFTSILPAGALGAGTKESDPKTDVVTLRWVWIDGEWYRAYDPNRQVMYIPLYPE